MQIIPVIDLMGGQVVQAYRGQRQHYAPLRSPLSPDAGPVSVVSGLMRLAAFATVYVADLDAILGSAPQSAIIAELLQRFPDTVFWVDAGLPLEPPVRTGRPGQWVPVLGSESLTEATLGELARWQADCVLSLDFRDDQPLGPGRIFREADRWPRDVILMTLGRVGSLEGPDLGRLESHVRRYPGHRLIAAGGVRHVADLESLQQAGAAAVLVASAIHRQWLDAAVIRRFNAGTVSR